MNDKVIRPSIEIIDEDTALVKNYKCPRCKEFGEIEVPLTKRGEKFYIENFTTAHICKNCSQKLIDAWKKSGALK